MTDSALPTTLPDPEVVEAYRRRPERGPRILFFSGGTALRELSRTLTSYTHHSVHLITPFDSGGSSAQLRQAFNMLSVGDIRNRVLALADESDLSVPPLQRLCAYRFPREACDEELEERLQDLASGGDLLEVYAAHPSLNFVKESLSIFLKSKPSSFDLRGASLGNLVIAGSFLLHDGDIDSVVSRFYREVHARGTIRAVSVDDFHLAARLESGRTVVGQHNLTGKEGDPLSERIDDMWLVRSLQDSSPVDSEAGSAVRREIRTADLIVFPMGSLWTSVGACLLPRGIGRSILEASCPKLYVPSTGHDPEMVGRRPHEGLEILTRLIARDLETDLAIGDVFDAVLLDPREGLYEGGFDRTEVSGDGIEVLEASLSTNASLPLLDPVLLSEALVSLCPKARARIPNN